MIGRGLVATPDLGRQIKELNYQPNTWQQHLGSLFPLSEQLSHLTDKQLTDRLKQWLHYFSMHSEAMKVVFDEVKRLREKEAFFAAIQRHQNG